MMVWAGLDGEVESTLKRLRLGRTVMGWTRKCSKVTQYMEVR